MPSIESAVNQANELLTRDVVKPVEKSSSSDMPSPPPLELQDTIRIFPMPALQSYPDSVKQNERNNLVPQFRTIPPPQPPPDNVQIAKEAPQQVSGGGRIVTSPGHVANVPGAPGDPGVPVGPIPVPPSDLGNLTATSPVNVSAVRQVVGGPAAISIDTFGASGASHQRGAVPDPGAVAGTARFLREDATFAIPPGSEPVTNGDPDFPEIVFADGDVVMM